jgi:uncharacterized membrane protein YqhA
MAEETPLYCYVHPKRETQLRCNRCERPICMECAVLTPTGYRCKECIRSQQRVFETAQSSDYILASIVAVILSLIGSLLVGIIGLFTLFLAPLVGMGIAESVRWINHHRRSSKLFILVAAATLVGSLPIIFISLINFLNIYQPRGGVPISWLLMLIWPIAYAVLVTTSVYYRLSGVHIG